MGNVFFASEKELREMDICENESDKKADSQNRIYSVAGPKDTEKCRGCPYPRVGFICWSTDGSCMKTDMEKISSKSRR